MKYYLKETLNSNGKVFEKGSVVDAKQLPKKSIDWLLDQEIIIKVDKKMEAKILEESVKGEEE